MIEPYKTRAKKNLKKANGQIACVLGMIEEGKYCMDIAQQVNAALGLLKKVNDYILESHLITCSPKKLSGNMAVKRKFAGEILRVCNVTNR